MRASLRRLFLDALATDDLAQPDDHGWTTRCLHCRTRLHVAPDGTPLGATTLEHIVPRAWFGRRAAQSSIARVGGHPHDARNLALACARCNHDKGKGHDARGPGDARALEVVSTLLDTRLERWREPRAQNL